MNALYLILIALGFTVGVIMSSVHSNKNIDMNYAEETEAECNDDLNFEAEAEVKTLSIFE